MRAGVPGLLSCTVWFLRRVREFRRHIPSGGGGEFTQPRGTTLPLAAPWIQTCMTGRQRGRAEQQQQRRDHQRAEDLPHAERRHRHQRRSPRGEETQVRE